MSGEVGIGKTLQIQDFVDEQRDAARVLWSACESPFTPQPLALRSDIARPAGGARSEALAVRGEASAIARRLGPRLQRSPERAVAIARRAAAAR